jgi:hypothetical protein
MAPPRRLPAIGMVDGSDETLVGHRFRGGLRRTTWLRYPRRSSSTSLVVTPADLRPTRPRPGRDGGPR